MSEEEQEYLVYSKRNGQTRNIYGGAIEPRVLYLLLYHIIHSSSPISMSFK
jgi:hypothetical protein